MESSSSSGTSGFPSSNPEGVPRNGPQPFVLGEPQSHNNSLAPPGPAVQRPLPPWILPGDEATLTCSFDIALFVYIEFSNIKVSRADLPKHWPSLKSYEALQHWICNEMSIAQSCMLLISASEGQQEQVLSQLVNKAHRKLSLGEEFDATESRDYFYGRLMQHCITKPSTGGVDLSIQSSILSVIQLLATVASLRQPITNRALAEILDVPEDELLNDLRRCTPLVMCVGSDDACQLFQPELIGFLEDPKRCKAIEHRDFQADEWVEIGIDWTEIDGKLAENCLRILDTELFQDICQVREPGTPRDKGKWDKAAIRENLLYASRKWAYHTADSGPHFIERNWDRVEQFLRTHFLHWIEVLAWTGCVHDSIEALAALQEVTQIYSPMMEFLSAAKQFVRKYQHLVGTAPLQLYYSGLLLTPDDYEIKKCFHNSMLISASVMPGGPARWKSQPGYHNAHEAPVSFVSFSPDGSRIISTASDHAIRVWVVETGENVRDIDILHGTNKAAMSPNGRMVATVGIKVIRIYDIDSGSYFQSLWFKDSTRNVTTLAFSPDNQSLVAGLKEPDSDSSVQMWEIQKAKQVHKRFLHEQPLSVGTVSFSPDGNYIVAGSEGEYSSHTWNVESEIMVDRRRSHEPEFRGQMSLSHNAQVIAYYGQRDAGSTYKKVLLKHIVYEATQTCDDLESISVQCVAFSPDNLHIAMGTEWGDIILGDIQTGVVLDTLDGRDQPVTAIAYSTDGRKLVCGGEDGSIRVEDIPTEPRVTRRLHHTGAVSILVLCPDGRHVLSCGGKDHNLKLWDTTTGAHVRDLQLDTDEEEKKERITAAVWSPDGQRVFAGSNAIRVWDRDNASGVRTRVIEVSAWRGPAVTCLAVSHDGARLAVGTTHMFMQVLDAATGELVRAVNPFAMPDARVVAFSPDGIWLAVGLNDSTLQVYNLASGECAFTGVVPLRERFEGWRGYWKPGFLEIAFSPTGDVIALRSGSEVVLVWWEDGKVEGWKHAVRGVVSPLEFMAFSPDGYWLQTNHGAVKLDTVRTFDEAGPWPEQDAVGLKYDWVTYRGKKVLLLPEEYRNGVYAGQGDVLVVGRPSGVVAVFNFADYVPPQH